MAEEKKKPTAKKPAVKEEPILELHELNKLHREGVVKRAKAEEKK